MRHVSLLLALGGLCFTACRTTDLREEASTFEPILAVEAGDGTGERPRLVSALPDFEPTGEERAMAEAYILQRGLGGRVLLTYVVEGAIDRDGIFIPSRIVDSRLPIFEKTVLRLMGQMVFTPPVRDGRSVPLPTVLSYRLNYYFPPARLPGPSDGIVM